MAAAAVLYEVNHVVDADVAGPFLDWLVPHIEELMTLPGFVAGTISEPEVDDATAGVCSLVTCSWASSMASRVVCRLQRWQDASLTLCTYL